MTEGRLWGGRFTEGPADAMLELSHSTQFDWRLAPHDIVGSRVHAKTFHTAGLLTYDEATAMDAGLVELLHRVRTGELAPSPTDEDVHGALERGLREIVGPELDGQLRAGRSRSDQIAIPIHSYLREEVRVLVAGVLDIVEALTGQAKKNLSAVMPGRTHLQPAQPVLLSHHLLAHAWSLLRDVSRLQDPDARLAVSPYGSAALAGTSLGLDPQLVARELGFTSSMPNFIDGIAARDPVAETAWILAQIGVDLPHLNEDVILWCTAEFGFMKLADEWSTGSSTMLQKKNPGVAELARGKAGRFIGNLSGPLATLRGMPPTYNRNLQEDKEPVFNGLDQPRILLPTVAGMIATLSFDHAHMAALAPAGFSLVTDVADHLVRMRVPFAVAHGVTGEAVRYCEQWGITLQDLTEADLPGISEYLDPGVLEVLMVEGSVNARNGRGGTATTRVAEQLGEVFVALEGNRSWTRASGAHRSRLSRPPRNPPLAKLVELGREKGATRTPSREAN